MPSPFFFQSYIATQIMVDSKMLRGHRQDGENTNNFYMENVKNVFV